MSSPATTADAAGVSSKPSPESSPEAQPSSADLGARTTAPMRYGTCELTDEPIGEPLERTVVAFDDRGARARLWDLAVGETRGLA